MGIKDALTAPPPTRTKKLEKHLAAMDDGLHAEAIRLLMSDVAAKRVADAFTEDGFDITENPIHNWRRVHRGNS
jgi:hypothetical protein